MSDMRIPTAMQASFGDNFWGNCRNLSYNEKARQNVSQIDPGSSIIFCGSSIYLDEEVKTFSYLELD